MFGVLKNFLNSEKAVASGMLVVASSVMAVTGQLTPQEWMAYTQTLLGIYVGGKTLQGAASALAGRAQANDDAAKAGLSDLNKKLADNDAAADAAVDEKFPDKDEEATDPGKKPHATTAEG